MQPKGRRPEFTYSKTNIIALEIKDLYLEKIQLISDLINWKVNIIFPQGWHQFISNTEYYSLKYGFFLDNHYERDIEINLINKDIWFWVFSKEELNKWDYIWEYTWLISKEYGKHGNKYRLSLLNPNNNPAQLMSLDYLFLYQLDIDAWEVWNFSRFINHSKNWNAETIHLFHNWNWRVFLIANKTINKWQQILFDYWEGYWGGDTAKVIDNIDSSIL